MLAPKIISWEDFEKEFKPIQNNITKREEFNGWLFETYGADEAHIQETAQKNPETVWTIVTADDGDLIISSGWHFVNRFGYIITEIPFPTNQEITVIDEDENEYNED